MHGWIRQCAASNRWTEGAGYLIGHRSIWLAYNAWKTVEGVVKATEKEQNRCSVVDFDDAESVPGDDVTDLIYGGGAGQEYASESRDNLLVTHVGSRGS